MPRKPKTADDYRDLADKSGLTWLGPEVNKVNIPTNWRCPERHEWPATYNSIQQGSGCPACGGSKPKTPDDYRALADKHGFIWLGPEVVNTKTSTNWRCPEGHEWP